LKPLIGRIERVAQDEGEPHLREAPADLGERPAVREADREGLAGPDRLAPELADARAAGLRDVQEAEAGIVAGLDLRLDLAHPPALTGQEGLGEALDRLRCPLLHAAPRGAGLGEGARPGDKGRSVLAVDVSRLRRPGERI